MKNRYEDIEKIDLINIYKFTQLEIQMRIEAFKQYSNIDLLQEINDFKVVCSELQAELKA